MQSAVCQTVWSAGHRLDGCRGGHDLVGTRQFLLPWRLCARLFWLLMSFRSSRAYGLTLSQVASTHGRTHDPFIFVQSLVRSSEYLLTDIRIMMVTSDIHLCRTTVVVPVTVFVQSCSTQTLHTHALTHFTPPPG